MCLYKSLYRILGVLLCHFLPYVLGTGSFNEPGAMGFQQGQTFLLFVSHIALRIRVSSGILIPECECWPSKVSPLNRKCAYSLS